MCTRYEVRLNWIPEIHPIWWRHRDALNIQEHRRGVLLADKFKFYPCTAWAALSLSTTDQTHVVGDNANSGPDRTIRAMIKPLASAGERNLPEGSIRLAFVRFSTTAPSVTRFVTHIITFDSPSVRAVAWGPHLARTVLFGGSRAISLCIWVVDKPDILPYLLKREFATWTAAIESDRRKRPALILPLVLTE